MYFSSLFPYVVLICFLIRALLLKGSIDGIRHMFTPKVMQVSVSLYSYNTTQSNTTVGKSNEFTEEEYFYVVFNHLIVVLQLNCFIVKLSCFVQLSPNPCR